jgi:PST family polysaccharide transporter
MRFTALAVIGTVSLVVGSAIAICGALAGYGYWALVAMTVITPLIYTICVWLTTSWIPGMPHRRVGMRSMMRFGGAITMNSLVVYVASNFEKVLIGRYWGVDAIGIYGRAYQLINIPTENLNSSVGEVAFSALSRVQDDPIRLRSYFLKGYSLVLALTLPITFACAFFASDIIYVLLGPKWKDAAPLFRLLAPTILVFAIANPLSWLLTSIGLVGRNLRIALFIAPTMIAGYIVGLHWGPKGVAFAYSTVLILWLLPLIAWCVYDTVVSVRDILLTVSKPLVSSIVAAMSAFGVQYLWAQSLPHLGRLVFETTVLLIVYVGMLLYAMGQRTVYIDLIRDLRGRAPVDKNALAVV